MNIEDFRCLKLSFGNFIFYFLSRVKKKRIQPLKFGISTGGRKEERKEKGKKGKISFSCQSLTK